MYIENRCLGFDTNIFAFRSRRYFILYKEKTHLAKKKGCLLELKISDFDIKRCFFVQNPRKAGCVFKLGYRHVCGAGRSHYNDVIMGGIASQITSLTIFCSTVYSDTDKRKHQSSALLAFVRGIHRGPMNSPHKWPVRRKRFPFDDVILIWAFFWTAGMRLVSAGSSRSVLGPILIERLTVFQVMEISVIEMGLSWHRLIFRMGIPILVRSL